MVKTLTSQVNLLDVGPEVNSYIYQQVLVFEPYITPNTVVAVIAKDPLKLRLVYESEGKEFDKQKMKKMYRIAMVLNESGTKVEAEGLSENLFEAISQARDNLLAHLQSIQDSIVSSQDRIVEIEEAKASGGTRH